ncbi:hypothetical protein OU415_19550 [Saccharopolyspora sp. WRP15-2]|uniref:Uncharacterized protein n=1 Tax=Saccharopolyspora oryzae TaxID=2997343 RepID=A0ABT4V106_9PSEU|nr:hypothetical protein [Saccharopolyspora oryzae]MDA3627644.1 hypothetical protein [Saccharopolyspora oryzae]
MSLDPLAERRKRACESWTAYYVTTLTGVGGVAGVLPFLLW